MIIATATLINTDDGSAEEIEIFTPETSAELASLLGLVEPEETDHTHSTYDPIPASKDL